MRNRFTVTISDVYGARHYSFNQLAKRFVWWSLAIVLLLILAGGFTLAWYADKIKRLDAQYHFALSHGSERLVAAQRHYDQVLEEKARLELEMTQAQQRLESVGQTLQNIEEVLLSQDPLAVLPEASFEERLANLQLNALERTLMLSAIPNGSAVKTFQGFSSYFGKRENPVTGDVMNHSGIDYRASTGEDVIATADGIVSFSAFSQETGFGNLVAITHANGFKTRYGHLDSRAVKVGEYVYKGQKVGTVGSTGRSTGPHLHYEVMFLSHRLDPKPFHDWSVENYMAVFQEVKLVPWESFVQAASLQAKRVEKQLLPQELASMASSEN
ncbi:MAG: peptidoglycan DD-metalloendopeptidase family protein [Thiotrichales bacterium]|nr:peptidoglycan DD-metalloendopeptidase family protein [Thiotrichales bacterium]